MCAFSHTGNGVYDPCNWRTLRRLAPSLTAKNVVMAYNSTGLVVHDADAHIMETPTWLRDNADPAFRNRIDALTYPGGNELQQSAIEFDENENLVAGFERLAQRHQAPAVSYTHLTLPTILLV